MSNSQINPAFDEAYLQFSAHDQYWMQHAIQLAHYAQQQGEVPVGAVLVLNNKIVGEGWNQSITQNDPTAHAEIVALRHAGKSLNNYRLLGTTLYVTLEPCMMCANALVHARVGRLVFAASDPKAGAVGSILNVLELSCLNHSVQWQKGLCSQICSQMLTAFFKSKRQKG